MKQSILKDPTSKEEIYNKTVEWEQRANNCIEDAKDNPDYAIEELKALREEMRNELEFARQTKNNLLESISQEINQSVRGKITKNNVHNNASDLETGLSYHLTMNF